MENGKIKSMIDYLKADKSFHATIRTLLLSKEINMK